MRILYEIYQVNFDPNVFVLFFIIKDFVCLQSEPHKAACQPTKGDIINDVKLLPTGSHRTFCCNFLSLSDQQVH